MKQCVDVHADLDLHLLHINEIDRDSSGCFYKFTRLFLTKLCLDLSSYIPDQKVDGVNPDQTAQSTGRPGSTLDSHPCGLISKEINYSRFLSKRLFFAKNRIV